MLDVKTKTFEISGQEAAVGEADLQLIQAFALREVRADEVYVRPLLLANTDIDRDFERFSLPVLQQFAESIAGKSLLIGHKRDAAPVALFYKAEVVQREDRPGSDLKAWFYMAKTAGNDDLRTQIETGVLRYVSIGFRAEKLVCDICGADMYGMPACPHVPGQTYEDRVATGTWEGQAEAVEGSIVYLGSQVGAEVVGKAATPKVKLPLFPEDEAWNPRGVPDSELIAAILGPDGDDWDAAKKVNAWWDPDNAEVQAGYKLKMGRRDPITDASGTLKYHWRQTASRMAILSGARGGADIPAEDFEPVYHRIAYVYSLFDKEPPPLEQIRAAQDDGDWKRVNWQHSEKQIAEEEWVTEDLARAIRTIQGTTDFLRGRGEKEGRVLSARNLELVRNAIEALQALLEAAIVADSEESGGKTEHTNEEGLYLALARVLAKE